MHEGEDRTRPTAIFVLSAVDIEGIDQQGNDGDEQVRYIDGYDFVPLTWAVIVGRVGQASGEAVVDDQCCTSLRSALVTHTTSQSTQTRVNWAKFNQSPVLGGLLTNTSDGSKELTTQKKDNVNSSVALIRLNNT